MIKSIITLMMCGIFFAFTPADKTPVEKIDFYHGELDKAKELAGAEGKLAFVDFYASWCGPCKWMDQTTFKDSKIIKELNANYVSVKINIDDFDGFAWKQQYNVGVLPTMLIFNSKGELVDRIEETLAPSTLLAKLKSHQSSLNTEIVKKYNSSPSDRYNTTSETVVRAAKRESYKVQVGIFENFEMTTDFYNEMVNNFDEPIIVLNNYTNNSIQYRVMMGDFKTEEEATIFRDKIQFEHGIEGFIR